MDRCAGSPHGGTIALEQTSTLKGLYDCREHGHASRPGHHRADPRSLGHPPKLGQVGRAIEGRGYSVLAPAYPGFEVVVETLNEDPSPIEALTIPAVVEHIEGIVGEPVEPPIIMGHSAGGFFTQVLSITVMA
jgi:hypothetical protein